MAVLAGGCHCGANRIAFETETTLALRACQCSFCRKHDARSVSDPDGSVCLRLAGDVVRYRFASHSADYLICSRCGSYLGALTELEGRLQATLNLNAFDDPRRELESAPVDYDGESVTAKAERRKGRWTPANLS